MSSFGSRRPVATATPWLTLLLGLVLGFVLAAAGSRVDGWSANPAIGLADGLGDEAVGAAQAWNHETPEQPPTRLLDSELDDSEDDDDQRSELTCDPPAAFEFVLVVTATVTGDEASDDPRGRVQTGQGARAPPQA